MVWFLVCLNVNCPCLVILNVLQTDDTELLAKCLVGDDLLNGTVCLSVRQHRLPCCRRSVVIELVFTSRTFETVR